jgi:hypothetical protein
VCSIAERERHKVLSRDGRNILFAVNLVGHRSGDNLPAQVRLPQQLSTAGVERLDMIRYLLSDAVSPCREG